MDKKKFTIVDDLTVESIKYYACLMHVYETFGSIQKFSDYYTEFYADNQEELDALKVLIKDLKVHQKERNGELKSCYKK